MIISYQGAECFKISQGDLSLVVNPTSKISADVTLFTSGHGEASEKAGFLIEGPGEYEIKDIFIKGFQIKDGETYKTTYLITFEGIKLCFLGAILPVKDIEDVDILLVPTSTDPAEAYKLAVALEPSVMIPFSSDDPSTGSGQGKGLAQFLKEGGQKVEAIDKYVVKKKDLEGKEGEIVLLREER